MLSATVLLFVGTISAIAASEQEYVRMKVYMQADNGNYLCLKEYAGSRYTPIETVDAEKDSTCLFELYYSEVENKFAFKAANGKFLTRVTRGDTESIEAAADTIDTRSKFRGEAVGDSLLDGAFMADNDKFLSRIGTGLYKNTIAADKDAIDESAILHSTPASGTYEK